MKSHLYHSLNVFSARLTLSYSDGKSPAAANTGPGSEQMHLGSGHTVTHYGNFPVGKYQTLLKYHSLWLKIVTE